MLGEIIVGDWLSPEAIKASDEAQTRARRFAPTLARTKAHAIVLRPSAYIGGPAARAFSVWMKANLPKFSFDSHRNRWQATLDQLAAAHAALTAGGQLCNVTAGARAELDKAHTVNDPRPDWPTVDVDSAVNPRRVIITRPAQVNERTGDFDVFMHIRLPWFIVSHGHWHADPCEIKTAVKVIAKRLGGCNVTPAAQDYLKELA
jgi:hypothetical protein